MKIAVETSTLIFILSGVLLAYCYINRPIASIEGQKEDTDFQIFNLDIMAKPTDDFSFDNKLGEGGFGSVYKGTMVDGQEIAMRRPPRSSGQGSYELKNEIALITKLQHRNLVKLLGYCIQVEEKLLDESKNIRTLAWLEHLKETIERGTQIVVETHGYMASEFVIDGNFSQHPGDRPSMSSVALMLESKTASMQTKEPSFLIDKKSFQTDSSLSKLESSSTNDISISLLEAG